MGNKQIVLSGKEFIRILEKMGFYIVRVNGSHHILRHDDGRQTTISVHKNRDISKGLMRKIIREELKIELIDFENIVKNS
jgi:predicted RNA binding protein YcfA (HicA-like mRNA interferase family)